MTMPNPPTKLEQNFNITPARPQIGLNSQAPQQNQISDEAYRTYNKLVDPEGIFLNKMTRMLYSGVLLHSDVYDPNSPMEGYRLVLLGGTARREPMSWEGYNMITSSYILLCSEVISTTEFNPKEIDLKRICQDGVMSIIDMAVANRKNWRIRDPMIYVPLGMAMWFNLYGIMRRSTGGGKMLMFITGLFKFLGSNRHEDEEPANRVRFFNRPRHT